MQWTGSLSAATLANLQLNHAKTIFPTILNYSSTGTALATKQYMERYIATGKQWSAWLESPLGVIQNNGPSTPLFFFLIILLNWILDEKKSKTILIPEFFLC